MSEIVDRLAVPPEDKEGIGKWIKDSEGRELKILITGRTGVGKSTLVNAIVGKDLAVEGRSLEAETMHVNKYAWVTTDGIHISLWDSPGLEDGSKQEKRYLREIKKNCSEVDIVIYCMKLDNRAELGRTQHDYLAIRKLNKAFGSKWWIHSIFVMTFANTLQLELEDQHEGNKSLVKKAFKRILHDWKGEIRNALIQVGVDRSIAKKVPVKPAGYTNEPHLPGRKYWFSSLWHKILKRMNESSQPILVKLGANRLKNSADVKDSDFDNTHEQPIVVDYAGIGAVFHGVAIGAGVGAGVGAGIGAAAGMGVGAGVGVALGGVAGSVAGLLIYLWIKRKKALKSKGKYAPNKE